METSSDEEWPDPSDRRDKAYFRAPPPETPRAARRNCAPAKLMRRETFGTFSGKTQRPERKVFEKIPPYLRFSLLDVVPKSLLMNHVFMGFTQCGQFLLSFTYHVRNGNAASRSDFREGYAFRLHFLSYTPGKKAQLAHSVPIFDDNCVDNRVAVSVAQWKHNPTLLVVYGIAELPTEHSYLSVIAVPRLGCRSCVALSNSSEDAESAMCEPVVQLAYHNQIVIYTDYIHILEIDLISSDQDDALHEDKYFNDNNPPSPKQNQQCNSSVNKIIQSILADFSDMEMVEPSPNMRAIQVPDVTHEFCIQSQPIAGCSEVYVGVDDCWDSVPSPRMLISPPLRSPSRRPAESLSRFSEIHRIADKTYEFVEETELKCEKLSLFRKRRLADKKYEFSEDNSENIVPFRVLRSNRKYYIGNSSKGQPRRPKSPSVESSGAGVLRAHNQIASSVLVLNSEMKYSPVITHFENREVVKESRILTVPEGGSLRTISIFGGCSKTLSDGAVYPEDDYLVHSGNSKCSEHFKRRFIETDDDITSIITDSEDDSINGYDVALPLIAHGAMYSPLQPVSMGAWEKMRTALPVLQASQKSLDIELLCNEVCVRLCRLHKKKFIYCFDWGCHIINVCQTSGSICGVCAMWLWASEEEVEGVGKTSLCQFCNEGSSCMVHRKQYAAECLFVWDLITAHYRTEHVSFKEDSTQDTLRESGSNLARQRALQLDPITSSHSQDIRLLTTVTGRSLKRLTDLDNCIEITKDNSDLSETESLSTEESDSD